MERRTTLFAVVVAVFVVGAVVPASAASPAAPGGTASATAQAVTCEFPVEYTDATGTTVTVEEEPERIVTMAPSAAQTMWEIGGKDKVVGVSQFATYLDGAEQRANISAPGFGKYNVERIVSLEPDLVLAPAVVPNAAVERIRSTGIKVVKFGDATSIADVRNKTETIGKLVGECEGATETIEWMDRNLATVQSAVSGTERPRVLYMTGTYTTGGNTYINDMIEAAGGTNIMAEAGVTGFAKASGEVVANRDPEWLLVTNPEAPIITKAPYNSTTAVQEGNVLTLNVNYVNQPAPRSVVVTVRTLAKNFHPDVYGEEDFVSREAVETTPTETRTETATVTETATAEETTAEETATETAMATETAPGTTDGGSSPGFGVVAAVVAVLTGAVMLLRRRH